MTIVTINGTLKSKTLLHVTNRKGVTVSFEGIPVVPYFVVEKQLLEEYKKWRIPLPTQLNKGIPIYKQIIGSKIPISSIYPKLKDEFECHEIVVGKVENKTGMGGVFQYNIPVNFEAPVEEFDALFGCLKSLNDIGIGGDRTFGFGDSEISINAVNCRPIGRWGIFKKVWDDEFIKPRPVITKRLKITEKLKYTHRLMKWVATRGVDWYGTSMKFLKFRESLKLPNVECRAFIDYSILENDSGLIEMHLCQLLRKVCRDKWRSMGRQAIRYFGGRVYHSANEYTPYESMVKFKPDRIVIEGSNEEVKELTDFVASTLDGEFVEHSRMKVSGTISIDNIRFKNREDYFKLDHWD